MFSIETGLAYQKLHRAGCIDWYQINERDL